jgi:T5orf172 domain
MVYFIQRDDDQAVKIGVTNRLATRFHSLQSAHRGSNLRIIGIMDGNYDVEQAIHGAFFDLRISGEWFAPDDQLARAIAP